MIRIGSFALQQKVIERLGVGLRRKVFAVRCRELNDSVPALRSFNDAAQMTKPFPAYGPPLRWRRS